MKIDLIKAWKDEAYRSTLTAEQLEAVKNPAGSINLSAEEMQNVNGGTFSSSFPDQNTSMICCVLK